MNREDSLLSIRGWLRQKTPAFRLDRQIFCVVTDTEFLTYLDEEQRTLENRIPLSQIKLVSQLPASSRPGFSLVLFNGSSLTYMDTSIHQAQKWICALQTEPSNEELNIDSFDLLKVIGRGASGKVFLAKRKNTDEIYAIKVIRKDELRPEGKDARVRAERNALMRAKHQFITRLFFAFQSPTKLYFVMEYAAGGDLRHHIDQHIVFSRQQIQIYLAELVIALRILHSLGIVYRDLKPENILLDQDGHIKLADFGLAREIDSETTASTLCGTCEYVAPEMLRHQTQTFAVDWWSFGVIAYQLLCNKLPFASASTGRLFDLIANSPPKIPNSLDPVAKAFLLALLQKNPANRLGSIGTDIAAHPFFEGIDWDRIVKRDYELDFVPYLNAPDSVENFDNSITSQEPADSYVDIGSLSLDVQGFSYVDMSPTFDMPFTMELSPIAND